MKNSKEIKHLNVIKTIVDTFYEGKYTITIGNDDFDTSNHIYDIDTIMGMISNHVYEGLSLNVPSRTKKKGSEDK